MQIELFHRKHDEVFITLNGIPLSFKGHRYSFMRKLGDWFWKIGQRQKGENGEPT